MTVGIRGKTGASFSEIWPPPNESVPKMALTDTAIRNAKPSPKTRKMYDSLGLFLEITPKGSKL